MERYIQTLLNRLSCASIIIATFLLLFLHTPADTCLPHHSRQFPTSSCYSSHRSYISLDTKNHRLWSTRAWNNTVHSFATLFLDLQPLTHLTNHSRVLCVSVGADHEIMALRQIGVGDVIAAELMETPPLVSRANPYNLPFFDEVFDLCFSAHLDQALFPGRFAAEMEQTVRVGGVLVLAVEECGDEEVGEVAKLFQKSRFISARNVTLIGLKMTRIILRK